GMFLSGADARDVSGAHQHSARVVGQRRPLDVEEHQRLLGLERSEEGVQHDLLVVEVIYPHRLKGESWLTFEVEGQRHAVCYSLRILLARPSERNGLEAVR